MQRSTKFAQGRLYVRLVQADTDSGNLVLTVLDLIGSLRMKSGTSAKRASIHEVARQSGCSITTVSNVVNNKGRVSAKHRTAILQVIERLQYVPNLAGRSLRLGRTESVGLLFYPSCASLFRNPFYAEVMEGLEEEFTRNHYHLLLTGFEASELPDRSSAQFLRGRVDAITLLGGFPYRIIEQLSHHPKPLVLIDTDADDLPLDSVVSDGVGGSRAVVNHLAELGHRRILMAAYQMEDYNIDARVRGFQQAARQAGLTETAEVLREHLLNPDVCEAVLARMKGADAPTAIYAVNDNLAFALKAALEGAGYRIPQDVSLVGFDDDDALGTTAHSLTTIQVDRKALGRAGAELVFRRIKEPSAPTSKMRQAVRLVVRGTTAPPPKMAQPSPAGPGRAKRKKAPRSSSARSA